MNQKHKLTLEGKKNLETELLLKKREREDNIVALKDAKAQGDLSENADYDTARDDQAKIAARITEIEQILNNYEIISDSVYDERDKGVRVGKWVKLLFTNENGDLILKDENVEIYKIVGTLEADPQDGKISDESPVGKAILGHNVDEIVYIKTENGREFKVKILEINNKEIKSRKKRT